MELKAKIRQFIIEELKKSDGNNDIPYLEDDTPLIADGIIDSLMILSMLAFLEEEFGIILSKGEFNPGNFATIQKIHDLVAQRVSNS
jgi:acyl carrier protein